MAAYKERRLRLACPQAVEAPGENPSMVRFHRTDGSLAVASMLRNAPDI
jgi:hypothetical protein